MYMSCRQGRVVRRKKIDGRTKFDLMYVHNRMFITREIFVEMWVYTTPLLCCIPNATV